MKNTVFYERFNREISLLNLPEEAFDKLKAVAKLFNITRHQANSMILDRMSPSEDELHRIAEVLDVCPLWLSGKTDKKKSYPRRDYSEITERETEAAE